MFLLSSSSCETLSVQALIAHVSRHRRFLRLVLVAGISLTSVDVVDAHHGRDFLVARTAELPHARQVFVVPRQDVVKNDHAAGIEVEPSLIAGATDWLALEVHSHIEKQPHEAFRYESTAAAIHFGVMPPEHSWAAGASVEYEVGHVADKPDRLEGQFVLSRSTDVMRLALNVIGEHDGPSREHDASTGVRWNYALAVRRRLADKLDWGMEGQGSLHDSSGHELLFGIYTEPTAHLTVNVGAGTGLSRNGPDFTLRTALVWQLR